MPNRKTCDGRIFYYPPEHLQIWGKHPEIKALAYTGEWYYENHAARSLSMADALICGGQAYSVVTCVQDVEWKLTRETFDRISELFLPLKDPVSREVLEALIVLGIYSRSKHATELRGEKSREKFIISLVNSGLMPSTSSMSENQLATIRNICLFMDLVKRKNMVEPGLTEEDFRLMAAAIICDVAGLTSPYKTTCGSTIFGEAMGVQLLALAKSKSLADIRELISLSD